MIKIGFSTPKIFNPISWLVRKITKSRCSHAWFLYYDRDFDMQMVMEAHEVGFRILPLDRFEKHNSIVKILQPAYDIDLGLKKVAHQYLGSPYDFMGLLGMAWVALGRALKKVWKNPFRSSKYVFCSEAVVRAMLWSDGYKDIGLVPDRTDPQRLLEFFETTEKA